MKRWAQAFRTAAAIVVLLVLTGFIFKEAAEFGFNACRQMVIKPQPTVYE